MKWFYLTLFLVSLVGILVVFFQNSIISTIAYSPMGITRTYNVIIYSSVLGFLGGFSLKSFFSLKEDRDIDDDF